MKTRKSLRRCLPALLLAATSALQAGTGTWSATTGGNWEDATTAPWTSGIVAGGATYTANITSDITADTTVTLTANRTIGNITINDTGATGDSRWILAGANTLTLDNGASQAVITKTSTTTISALLAGSNIRITGGAGLTITGNNTGITGNVALNGVNGVSISNANALGNALITFTASEVFGGSTTGVTIANNIAFSGGVLWYSGGNGLKTTGSVTLSGAGQGYNNFGSGNTTEWAGNTVLGANTLIVQGGGTGGLIISGLISGTGGSIAKSGVSTLTLTGLVANTYTGGTTINGGTISLGTGGTGANTSHAAALGTGAVTINTGGTLKLWIQNSTTHAIANNLTINGGTLLAQDGVYDMSGTVNVGASGATFSAVYGTKNLYMNNAISGTGPVTITAGGGLVRFVGNNNYTGATSVNTGTLVISNANTSSGFTVASGATLALRAITLSSTQNITGAGNVTKDISVYGVSSIAGTNNNYTGTTTVNIDKFTLASGGVINGTSSISVLGQFAAQFENLGSVTTPGAVTVNGSSSASDGIFNNGNTAGTTPGSLAAASITLQSSFISHATNLAHGGEFNNRLNSTVNLGSGTITVNGQGNALAGGSTAAGSTFSNAGAVVAGSLTLNSSSTANTASNKGGTFTQTGGTTTLSGTATLAANGGVGAAGTAGNDAAFNLSGGTFAASSIAVNSGTLTATGGTLNIGSGGITTTGTNTIAVNLGATTLGATAAWTSAVNTTVTNTSTGTTVNTTGGNIGLTGVVSGSGKITKSGTGTLTLSGANGSIAASGGIILAKGTLRLLNTATENNPDRLNDSAIITLAGGALAFSNDASSANFNETITLAVTGAGTITTDQANPGQNSVLTIDWLDRTTGSIDFAGTGLGSVDNRNMILIAGQPDGLIGRWATCNGTDWANYDVDQGVVPFAGYTDVARLGGSVASAPGSSVRIIDDGISGDVTLATTGTTSIDSLLQGATGESATLDIGSGNTLRLAQDGGILVPASSGALTINNGTLTAGGASANTAGTLFLVNNQASTGLVIQSAVANNGSGMVGLDVSGSGTTSLTGASTFTGTTAIGGTATLQVSGAGTLGSTGTYAGNIVVNGTLQYSSSAAQTLNGVVSGAGSLVKDGAATLTLGGANTYAGGTTMNGGTIRVNNATALGTSSANVLGNSTLTVSSSFANNIAINSGVTLTLNGGFNNVNGIVSGAGNVTADNSIQLRGENTYTGLTTVSGGYLCIDRDRNLGAAPLAFTSNSLTLTGGGNLSNYIATSPVVLNANRGITLSSGNTGGFDVTGQSLTVNGVITGAGNLNKLNSGVLILTANNTYGGNTVVNASAGELRSEMGTRATGTYTPFSTGSVTMNSATTLRLRAGSTPNQYTIGNAINLNAATLAYEDGNHILTGNIAMTGANTVTGYYTGKDLRVNGVISGTGSLTFNRFYAGNTPIVTLAGANTYTGNIVVATGSAIVLAPVTGQLKFSVGNAGATNTISGAGQATFNGTFTIDTSAVTNATGTWTLANVTTQSFDAVTFSVAGFDDSDNDGKWTKPATHVANSQWVFNEADGTLKIELLAVDPYDTWAGPTGYNLTGGKAGDDDGDGVSNFIEFATNANPKNPASGARVFPWLHTTGLDTYLTYTVAVRKDAVFAVADTTKQQADKDGVRYTVEATGSLTTWNAVVSELDITNAGLVQAAILPALPALDADWTYHTFRTDATTATDPQDFIRLKVEETPALP